MKQESILNGLINQVKMSCFITITSVQLKP